jgi:hypothetical protein
MVIIAWGMNLRERVIPLNITDQRSICCWDWCSPHIVTLFLGGKCQDIQDMLTVHVLNIFDFRKYT